MASPLSASASVRSSEQRAPRPEHINPWSSPGKCRLDMKTRSKGTQYITSYISIQI